jgi:hypothetical protein
MSYGAARFTREVVPGTYQATPPAADTAIIGLFGDDAFPGRLEPIRWGPILDAGGSNRPVMDGASQQATKGSINTLLFLSQAKALLPWMFTVAGTPLDAQSATFDHKYRMGDASSTLVYQRHLGAKCRQATLTAGNNGRANLFALSAQYDFLSAATITNTDFATPVLTDYPWATATPATFQMTAGGFTLNAARTKFRSLEISVANTTEPLYDEGVTPNTIFWGGRRVTLKASFRLVSQADRADFLAVTSRAATVVITDGTTTVTFAFHANCKYTEATDSLPLGGAPYQMLTAEALVDATAGSDLDVTIAP